MAQIFQFLVILTLSSVVVGSIVNDVLDEVDVRAKKSKDHRFCFHTCLFKDAYEQLIEDNKAMHPDMCLTEVVTDIDTNYYYFSKPEEATTWADANDFCLAHGMNLARVDTIPDLMALFAASGEKLEDADSFLWVILNDQAVEGVFEWSLMGNKTSDAWLAAYAWHADEPTSCTHSADGEDQDCVAMTKRDTCVRLEDRACADVGMFICRLNPVYRDLLNFRCHSS